MTRLVTSSFLFAALVVLLVACAPSHASTPHVAYDLNAKIEWQSFDKPAFDQARRENKLVLVDVGIEGCTACRWMATGTYRNPAVIARVRENFVAVAVDADVQPDLGARYEPWGWPATIALTPDGEQVFALRGSQPADEFLPMLDNLIVQKKNGTLHADGVAPASSVKPSAMHDACVRVTASLDKNMDRDHGGWPDDGMQFIQGLNIEETFLRAQVEHRPDLRAHALKTLDGYANLLDKEWGGVFVAGHNVDFTGVIVEKRLVQEAEVLRSFAMAFAATHDEKWRQRASEIDRYIEGFLLAPDGTFYSTQQDAAPALPPSMNSEQYFLLPDKERRKYGIPPVDHAVYTDQNGQAIEAYAMLFEATGDERMLARATRAAATLLSTRMPPGGFVMQVATSKELEADIRKRAFRAVPVSYLTAQAHFARALVALFRVTADSRWFEAARTIMTAARATLEDPKLGGFFASPSNPSDLASQDKPVYENIVAARVLHSLSVYAHDDSLDHAAQRTLSAIGFAGGASLALAAEDLTLGPIDLSIVGAPTDARAAALFQSALKVYEPRKAVHYDAAGRYPDRGKPALYACTRNACSSPVYDPATVATVVATMSEPHPSACERWERGRESMPFP